MGSPLQEIFQGRGDQKGKGFWIKRSVPLLFIVSTWLGLLIDFPETKPQLWFPLSVFTTVVYLVLHLSEKRKEFSIEFLFSLVLLIAGTSHALHFQWLKLVYFPFIVLMTAFYGLNTIIPLSLLIPFLELKTFLSKENFIEESAFSVFLIITAIISPVIVNRLRREKEKAELSLKSLRDDAKNITHEAHMESLNSDKVVSLYFASVLKTDEEIRELLHIIKNAVFADSAHLFVPQINSLELRCTTDEEANIIISGKGAIIQCMQNKKPFSASEINEKEFEVGYIKREKITSLIAHPVMEGSAVIGVLAVDSARYQAFNEPDKELMQLCSRHLVRILEKERIYPKIKLDHSRLHILHEESYQLLSSLDSGVVIDKLCDGARKIASSQVYCFIARSKRFELVYNSALTGESRKLYDLRGTFINMAVENRQPLYMSDITTYRNPILPFKTHDARSVIVIPLAYENILLGLLVMLSEKIDFFDPLQFEMLKVLCNQASTSIANANLHAEIEKLATTDGLTGLYNHRLFQEKLSEEMRRLKRSSGPLALLLSDIDYFKKINDAYGHPVGDMVLKGVAKVIKATIRDIDIPARYGGEEFATILPGTDGNGALKIAERLRKTIMKTSFAGDGKSFTITMSIGIATSPDDAENKEDLIEKADEALYHAKNNGRNQTVLWTRIA